MKKKDFLDQKTKSRADLEKVLGEYRERLEVLRFELAQGKVKNIREIRSVRKSIAQLMTLLKSKP